ncbi:uncharacterized protein LOC105841974 [Bombyx mori]|uniref:Uncharacterized protein n=1 Tax=Bombyx mori TaxID=7091 RepID=A0A8R2C6U4_BOMMO|nr:uncharacterized protein LOC105841974 [Bombyx mori]
MSKNSSATVSLKKSSTKRPRELGEKVVDHPQIALAAITSYKKQIEISEFINFLLEALERNAVWLNTLVGNQNNFKCALMVGAGPNRFQIQEIIYPARNNNVKLEVELKDSEDHDKIAVAAVLQLSNADITNLLKYIKTRLFENSMLKDDLLKGKSMGVGFALLRPFNDKQYRVMERIVISSPTKCLTTVKKRKDEKIFNAPPIKRTKKILT